jgi:VWFA-related protein
MKGKTQVPAAITLSLLAAPGLAQAPPAPPVFGVAVELVRLDVIVLDREGRPVTGLRREDFVVEEDDRPQAIESFEPVVVRASRPPVLEPPRLSANRLRAPSEGRCVLLFVDDVHVAPANMAGVRRAIRRFLETDVREGDWVTLVAAKQQLWWTGRSAWEHRQLASVAERLVGQGRGDSYGDWARVRAVEFGQEGIGGQSRAVSTAGGGGQGGPGELGAIADPNAPVKQEEAIAAVRRRTEESLGALQQALDSLVRLRGQKSLVLVSEGFVLLPRMPGYREAMDLARRANVAIHFLDPRGLEADQGGTALALAMSDVDAVVAATGGTILPGNDPQAGLRRVAERSDAYYLLGYQPERLAPGERRVRVRVRSEGLEVRARSLYYVPEPATPAKDARKPAPGMAAMRSLADTTDLPIRIATLFYEPSRRGEVVTMLAAEVVPPPGKAGKRLFKLVSETRSRDGAPPVRDQFEGSPEVQPGVPIVLSRQWSLPSGVWQVRLLVEDTTTGRIGTAFHTFEVPEGKAFRMSTPILTTELGDPDGKRQPKVALSRTYRSGSIVYCQYSVYNAPPFGKGDWAPHVLGSWVLRRGEDVVREAPFTLIQPASDGRVTRTLGISLEGAPPGEYSVELVVRDEKTGASVSRREPFTVAP